MDSDISQVIINKLFSVYKNNGYLRTSTIFEALDGLNIPLYDVDHICEQLLSMGVIVRDDPSAYVADEDEEYDRSQTDYEQLYVEVLSIDEGLAQFIEQIRHIQPPQHREWQMLMPQAKNGNQFAYQRLLEMYLRTVVKLALAVHKKYNTPLADTIQEGCIGLMMALDKYELGHQDVYPSYFPLWVRQNILRQMPFTLNPSVHFPVHVRDKLYRIYDIVIGHECDECAGIDPCPGLTFEVAVALDCSVENAERYLQFFKPYDSVDEIITTDPLVLSDHGCSEDDLIETHDRKELKLLLGNVISIITPKEKEVLQLRFGLLDGEERTLEQIGNALGVSRERIRQIEAKAIRKLQHPTRIRYLKGLAEQMF